MYFFSYQDVKAIDAQRRDRSLARFEADKAIRERASSPAPRATVLGEVIELSFAEDCQHAEPMGA